MIDLIELIQMQQIGKKWHAYCLRVSLLEEICCRLLLSPKVQLTCALLGASLVYLCRSYVVVLGSLCSSLLVRSQLDLRVSMCGWATQNRSCTNRLWKRLIGSILLVMSLV